YPRVSRAQRSTISAFTRVFARYGGALQTRDPASEPGSRISGASLRKCCALHRIRDTCGQLWYQPHTTWHTSDDQRRRRSAPPPLNVGPDDRVSIDGKPLPRRERTRLFLFHKPRGLVTTSSDPQGRPTIFGALPKDLPRLISVGRLDLNTEGLLLLTNDGGLARALELPSTAWLRRYRVRAHGKVTQEQLDALREGV